MNQEKNVDLRAFYSAYNILIRTAKRTVNSINGNPTPIVEFCRILEEAKETDKRIHFVGMGRSGKVAMLIGELLKNIGFQVSYLGKSLSKPVRRDDVVIGVTGSGWTGFTTKAIEDSIRNNAKVLVFTGDKNSKAARLADTIIQIPIGYVKDKSTVKRAPLTPMGTIFEMTAMVIGIGAVSGIYDGSTVKGFNEGVNEVLRSAEMTLDNFHKDDKGLRKFITTLEEYSNHHDKRVFIYGSGLDSIVASISAIRFSHLKINVNTSYDWRFRGKNDLLVAISGSGVSTSTLERVNSAKDTDMLITGLSSFPESKLGQLSDIFLEIEGRATQESADLMKIDDLKFFVPSFEYVTAITLDSCVAQLALELKISESQMKAEHANIE